MCCPVVERVMMRVGFIFAVVFLLSYLYFLAPVDHLHQVYLSYRTPVGTSLRITGYNAVQMYDQD